MAYETEEARRLVIEAGQRLQSEGLIVRTWGNISARISDTQFVITPSGKAYETLTPEDIVIVNIKKCTYEGDIKPSSECGIHADVFAMRPEVNFVIHTHQTYASVVSIVGEDIELSEEEKQFLGEKIPCAAYGAIQLAVYMGFTEIYLLGVDFNYSVTIDNEGNIMKHKGVKDYFSNDNNENLNLPDLEKSLLAV